MVNRKLTPTFHCEPIIFYLVASTIIQRDVGETEATTNRCRL